MATLVLTALGTAVGGPLGGALGSLIGNQIDRAVLGGGSREGPRLRELAVTGSSYGAPIPRHYGTMRAAGSIIWATDLIETSEENGGGKGRPSITSYSYSVSFAVALASRPIRSLERVWADGNLLRGTAGDLKTGGELRVYLGHGDQTPDPLIASDKGAGCPAFRGTAYCVFEGLQLADFGNRIPALAFEIVADDGEVTLADLVETFDGPVEAHVPLPGLAGYRDEGGPLASTLAAIDQVYPLACDAGADRLRLSPGDGVPAEPVLLPEAAIDASDESFGGLAGHSRRRQPDASAVPAGLRYYDVARDYQAGLQRADGRARPGHAQVIEFPAALSASKARLLANAAAERAGAARETLAWRVAELDPSTGPGAVVRVPGHQGLWRIETWEWREHGVELELSRQPHGAARQTPGDAGEALPAADHVATPTVLAAFELPWDGTGSAEARQVFATASSESTGWTGAALYADESGSLVPLGPTGKRRCIVGRLANALGPSSAMLLEREASVEVELASADFALTSADPGAIADGANRALVGEEVLQFARAERTGARRWRLIGLLRGRAGTEAAAHLGHADDTTFVLLDARPVQVDPVKLGTASAIAAIGLVDPAPVVATIAGAGATLRPLTPVHPRTVEAAGSVTLCWTRRSRGAWRWLDGVDVPLGEQAEAYLVGLGPLGAPLAVWQVGEPLLALPSAEFAQLAADHPGAPLWVRQIGTSAPSDPLLLTTL